MAKKQNKNYRKNNDILEKQCNICLMWFSCNSEYFYINKSNKTDGLYPYCKKCASNKVIKKYKIDPEQYKKRAKKQHEKSPEYFAQKHKKYWNKNKEKASQRARDFRKNNPDRISKYSKSWQERKAHTITEKEWSNCKKYFENSCAYCGLLLNKHYKKHNGELISIDFHKEHVIDNGFNDLSNCVPSCSSCNSSKWKHELNKWYNSENSIFTIERYKKIIKWIEIDHLRYFDDKSG